jgi:photosystem II stability/assembly factor-like uncharacterized protein
MKAALWLAALACAALGDGDGASVRFLDDFRWREIGPCNMGGRIVDLAVVESKPQHFYAGVATGGVWKTVNHGTTWTPVFEGQGTGSIGDVTLAPSNPEILWVGTGEANARNSVTHGDGVYKSTDGGKTFRNMGLRGTRHIGRIAVHPRDPEVVYVAALGCIYAPSRERGLFRTADGGKTWACVNFIDEETGFIDVAIDPEDPQTVYGAAFSVRRDGFTSSASPSRFVEKAGLYKSSDGGSTWKKLAQGLPSIGVGRGGIDLWRKDPKVLYAILETSLTPQSISPGGPGGGGGAFMGISAEDQDEGVVLTAVNEGGPAQKAGLMVGDVVREIAGKKVESYQDFVGEIRRRRPGDKVQVKILRGGQEKTLEVTLGPRQEEHYPREISLQDPANKGGVYRSDDRGETWKHLATLNPRPWYYSQIRIDPNDDKRIYVLGVQLHVSSDGGKTFSNNGAPGIHVDHHALWIDPRDSDHLLLGCDGGMNTSYDRGRTWEHLANLPIGQFYAVGLDLQRPYWAYGGLQDNGCWGGPTQTRDAGIVNEHFVSINGGDGFYCRIDPSDPSVVYCESQYGAAVRLDRRTGARKQIRPRGTGLRFEWNTPLELSPHDPKRVYLGAQKLFESADRGDAWKEVSPELTRTKQGAISVIGLSPVDENVLWAGTNDGAVHVTRDRGKTWEEARIPGMPELRWVSRVECSRRGAGTAYVSFDGRRKDDLKPYVWKTSDFGRSWTSVTKGLPADETVYVVREDPKNPDLVFSGTERSVYFSLGAGARWQKLGQGLPVVPVHDLAVHPRDGELVAATHGRSLWVMDVKALQETTAAVLLSAAHLYEPREAVLWNPGRSRWFGGAKGFRGQNPPAGVSIVYYLRKDDPDLALAVQDKAGKTVAALKAEKKAGLHHATWNLMTARGRVTAGEYTVTLAAHGEKLDRKVRVVEDPANAAPSEK